MRSQGIAVDAGRLLTTCGGTQAIDLICRAFVQPGDAVLVEEPGYFLLFGRLRETGARIVPIARRHDGIDLQQLEAACKEHRPRLLFLQSVLHNPTGWGSTPANLHRVLMLAQNARLPGRRRRRAGHFHPGAPMRLAQLAGARPGHLLLELLQGAEPGAAARLRGRRAGAAEAVAATQDLFGADDAGAHEFVLLELLAAGRWRKHLDRLQQKLAAARAVSTRSCAPPVCCSSIRPKAGCSCGAACRTAPTSTRS